MSSKPSLPNLRGNTARKSVARIQLRSSSNENTDKNPTVAKIKKEVPEDEIKEYAATAMSELLGWYGYEKVDSGCTRGLNLDHFGTSVNLRRHNTNNRHREIITPLSVNDAQTTSSISPTDRTKGSSRSPISCRASRSSPTAVSIGSAKDNGSLGGGHRPSSRSSSLQTGPASPRVLDNSDSASDTPDGATNCSWCGRASGTWEPGNGSLSFTLTSNNSGRFCSEACFAAGRRAAFKRARTCDWCKHVRHSVSYVDFQDGESQLQFCSDKCLNQYKMNIFCRETQAHLALHGIPTLPSSSINPSTCAAGLITPELWLRDCRSPPPNPDEENVIVDGDEGDEEEEDEGENGRTGEENQSFVVQAEVRSSREPPILSTSMPLEKSVNESKFSSITLKKLEESEERKEAEAHDKRLRFEVNEAIRESLLEEEHRCRALKLEQSRRNNSHEPTRLRDLPEIDNSSISSINNETIVEKSEKRKETVLLLKDVNKLLASNATRGHPRQRRVSRSPPWHPPEHLRPPSSTNFSDNLYHSRFSSASSRPLPNHHPLHRPVNADPTSFHSVASKIHQNHDATSTLLPPVTVLVPYPIPIPIPIPIPVPIPLFGKFFGDYQAERKSPSAARPTDPGTLPEDLSKRRNKMEVDEEIEKSVHTSNSQDFASSRNSPEPSCSSRNTDNQRDFNSLDKSKFETMNASRPLRKRRRVNDNGTEDTEIRVDKRRTKFVPV